MKHMTNYKRALRDLNVLLALSSLMLVGCFAGGGSSRSSVDPSIQELRRLQADQTTVIASIRSDIRELVGRLDELEHSQTQIQVFKDDINKIESRLPPPEGVPLSELNADMRQAEKNGDREFLSSLMMIRSAKFADALSSLESYIKSEGPSANSLYWLGIANESYGYLEKALGAYHESASTFPKHSLAPAALMRQSDVFIKLSDKDSAKLTLQKIIASYPKSTYASLAKSKLKIL